MKKLKTIILIAGILSSQISLAQLGGLLNKAKNKITQEKKESENKASNDKYSNAEKEENKNNTEIKKAAEDSIQAIGRLLSKMVINRFQVIKGIYFFDNEGTDKNGIDYLTNKRQFALFKTTTSSPSYNDFFSLKERYYKFKKEAGREEGDTYEIDDNIKYTELSMKKADSIVYSFVTRKSTLPTIKDISHLSDGKQVYNETQAENTIKESVNACNVYNECLIRIKNDKSINLSKRTIFAIDSLFQEVEAAKIDLASYMNDKTKIKNLLSLGLENWKKIEFERAENRDKESYKALHGDNPIKFNEYDHSSAEFESIAKKHFLSKDYIEFKDYLKEVKVTQIINSYSIPGGFQFEKNSLGVPLSKYKTVLVYFKNSIGQCREGMATFRFTYIGGGKYNDKWTMDAGSMWVPCEILKK